MSPSSLQSPGIALLLAVYAHGVFQGGSSSWRPYYGPYVGRPGRSYGQPGHGYSRPHTGYGPPKANSIHSSHSVSASFSRPTTIHGSHSVTTSYGSSHGQDHGQHGGYHSNPCGTFIACSDDKACPSGQYCAESPHLPRCGKECLPDLPNTYACDRDYQCRSNYCEPYTHKCRLRPSPPDPCKGFMVCQGDEQCSADRYCGESPHLSQCGHECLPDLPNTYDCDRDYQCRSDYCEPNTHKCRLRPSPPDPCKGFMVCQGHEHCPADRFCGESPHLSQCGHECLPDLPNTYACYIDYQCRSNYCDPVAKVCRDKPSPPDPCAGFFACQGDEMCNVIQHCTLSPLRPHCGAECVPDLPNMAYCQRDNQCLSGYCDPGHHLCKPQCYGVHSCYSDEGCASSEHCSLSQTNPECGKECQPDYPDMTYPCDRDYQCQSDYCDPDVDQCKSPCSDFVPCQEDFECALTEHCAPSPTQPICGNKCVPDQPDMISCSRHDECLSDYCEPTLMQCKPRVTPPPQPCCLFGFRRLGDSCYEVQRTKSSYDEARTVCATQFNGDLSTVPTQEVNDLVVQLLDDVGATSAWVGITDRETEGTFSDVTGAQLVFSQWAPRRPQLNIAKNCVEVVGDGFSDAGESLSPGEWNDQQCSKKRNFVCQAPLLPICPKVRR